MGTLSGRVTPAMLVECRPFCGSAGCLGDRASASMCDVPFFGLFALLGGDCHAKPSCTQCMAAGGDPHGESAVSISLEHGGG